MRVLLRSIVLEEIRYLTNKEPIRKSPVRFNSIHLHTRERRVFDDDSDPHADPDL